MSSIPLRLAATLFRAGFLAAVTATIGACSQATRSPDTAAASSEAPANSGASVARPAPSGDPTSGWASLPRENGATLRAKVTSYTQAARPTLVVFFSATCPGCVDALLSDLEMKKRVGSAYRIGFALVDEDDAEFETYAAKIHVSADIDVWRVDDATNDLRSRCHMGTYPAWCVLDEKSNVVASGEGGDVTRELELARAKQAWDKNAILERATTAIDAAIAAPEDARLRARAVEAARGLGHLENDRAWDLAQAKQAPELAVALARDAAESADGLDIATLDTYAYALAQAGYAAQAVAVQTRTLAVCDWVATSCSEERERFERFKVAAAAR